MGTKALAKRILNQLFHEKRTLAIIFVAPIIILSLIYFIMGDGSTTYEIAAISPPKAFVSELKQVQGMDINVREFSKEKAISMVKEGKVIAAVEVDREGGEVVIYLDGSDNASATKVQGAIKYAVSAWVQEKIKAELAEIQSRSGITGMTADPPEIQVQYIYGSENGKFFDNYGASLIGIIVFFVVFLVAGINFLTERTSGALERLLSTPIKRREIIGGYVLGFSVLAIIQTLLVTFFCTEIIKMTIVGSIGLVLIVNLLTAICALTLAMLLSTLANSEFQMVQFIPLVIVPQIFLCGLFKLSGIMESISMIVPLKYTSSALTDIMLRGKGLSSVGGDCLILLGFSVVFMFLNIIVLKKYRAV